VTDAVVTNVDGRPLSRRGLDTRRRLLDAAERVFGELGFHEASVVKLAEAAGVAAGTYYLYFDSKKAIFEELMRDLNRRIRRAMSEGAEQGTTRIDAELRGFAAYFRFTAEHPALYRIIRQSEFVAPEMLRYHYDRVAEGYVAALDKAMESGEIAKLDPEVTAYALMGLGELVGMRWILWGDGREVPKHVLTELERIVRSILEVGTRK
jgi:AcrR family transcriptional regulator